MSVPGTEETVEVLVSLAPDALPQLVEQLESAVGQKAASVTPLPGSLDVLFVCPDEATAESLVNRAMALDYVQTVER